MEKKLTRRDFLKSASLISALTVLPDSSSDLEKTAEKPEFDNALDELKYISENRPGCVPSPISYGLMKKAIKEGVGEISKGGAYNIEVNEKEGKYRHCLSSRKLGLFFFCYTDRKVDAQGIFV